MNEEELFLAALEQPDADSRQAFLTVACQGDESLLQQVEQLLTAHFQSGEFLDVSVPAQIQQDAKISSGVTIRGHDPATVSDGATVRLDFLAPSTRPDSLGRLAHYEVLQVMGQGGFGIVLKAYDEVLQRIVAIKVLSPQLAAASPARKRFLREARCSAAVRHENVVQVYEVGEQPLPYLVMEFIPGETLQQRLDRVGPLDLAETLQIGRQIAAGLSAAHATDLVHRDIKPSNVLIEEGQLKVKITDFGLARATDDASLTQSGMIAGTPMYMAPEQVHGHPLDQRTDLFSLGSVLYQMVTGRAPFRANTTIAVLKRVADDKPRNIRELIPEAPQWLCDIIAKLHAKKPVERFQTSREVAELLADCEAKMLAGQLRELSNIVRTPAVRSKRRWPNLAIVVAAMLLLALVGYVFRPGRAGQQQPSGDLAQAASAAALSSVTPAPTTPEPTTPQPMLTPFTNSIGMEFVVVPKGKSWLGGGQGKLGDKEVEMPADFYLGKYEVTQSQWKTVMGSNPAFFARNSYGELEVAGLSDTEVQQLPIESITWEDCQEFIDKLNKLENDPHWVYRLPTENEWEYACRGGPLTEREQSAFDFYLAEPTNELLSTQANFQRNLNRTAPVGTYQPNRLNLFDMHGNVWEWCHDEFETASGKEYATRGGCWTTQAKYCLTSHSFRANSQKNLLRGLRLARVQK